MANEGTVRIQLTFKNSSKNIDFSYDSGVIEFDIAGDNIHDTIQDVGTSEEALSIGDTSVGGYVVVQNLDSTNYVEVRQGTGIADTLRVLAGDAQCFRITNDATAPFVIADTATVRMRVISFSL